jgi:hypothetical protein
MKAGQVLGLVIGIVGVALVTQPQPGHAISYAAVCAALGAAFCYGLAGGYMKRWASEVPSRGMAAGTQLAAGILLAPFIACRRPRRQPTPLCAASMLALGVVCGAIAYLLYFRLVADIGATGALTVTYLIPVFGVLWGALFLGEAVSLLHARRRSARDPRNGAQFSCSQELVLDKLVRRLEVHLPELGGARVFALGSACTTAGSAGAARRTGKDRTAPCARRRPHRHAPALAAKAGWNRVDMVFIGLLAAEVEAEQIPHLHHAVVGRKALA